MDQLQTQGMTWFLWRLHLQVARWPRWGETVAIETWPSALGRPYVIRDFRIRDGETEIGLATSAWLLMDTERKRPIRRIPAQIRALHPEPPLRALVDSFQRLPAVETATVCQRLNVRRGDLDLNGHLNHVATINALVEAVEPEVFYGQQLSALEVEFKGEGHEGDGLTSRCCQEPGCIEPDYIETPNNQTSCVPPFETLQHSLVRDADDKEIARGRSCWQLR